MQRLNRRLIRKMILKEMSMHGHGHHGKPQPGTHEYDTTAQVIQNCVMACIQRGVCDEMQVNMMCQQMCQDYGCPQFAGYCAQRVISSCRQMGL
jgi:hypothetical protein